jgi:hypothetical protein
MKLFTRKIFYGASNRDGSGPSGEMMAELRRQVEQLMSLDAGLEQMGLACHEEKSKLAREHRRLDQQRERLTKSIRTGLGI